MEVTVHRQVKTLLPLQLLNQPRKKTQMTYRQGDVLIERISEIPKEAKAHKRDAGRIVLAYGEVTGHAHAIHSKNAKAFKIEGDDALYLALKASCDLKHEEHTTIQLPEAFYKVTRQREYSPEAIRNVAD